MIRIKALNLHTEHEEIFYITNTINLESFKEALNYVKHGTRGYWVRCKRQILEVDENYEPKFRQECKYICTENEDGSQEIVVFPTTINHDFMYNAIQYLDENFRKRLSAGFTDGLSCYGRSETLNLDSDPEHFKLIA